MEYQQDDTLLKVRSSQGILASAFRLYTRSFGQMLKASWIHLLDTALVTTAAGMLVVYSLYLMVPLVAVAVALELVLWLMVTRWLTKRPLRKLFSYAKRHWLLLTGIVIGGWLALLPVCGVVSLPLIVLTLAEWESENSVMQGDTVSMPSYIPYLSAVVWFVTACLQILIRLLIVYMAYYAWGSAETRQREREQQKMTIA